MQKLYVLIFLFAYSFTNLVYSQTLGLLLNSPDSYNGYTLFAPTGSKNTYLMDNCSRIVKSWESAFPPGMQAYLLENSNLIRAKRVNSSFFQGGGIGGGIEIFSWDGDLIWSYDIANASQHQHHDIEYLPNGNILAIAWERISLELAMSKGRDPNLLPNNSLWPDMILELKPIGSDQAEVVWEWHLWDHLVQDYDSTLDNYGEVKEHPELFNINYLGPNMGNGNAQSDWVHCNAIDYNAELDQIMINSRTINELWIIDHSTTTEEAASHSGGRYGKGGDFLYRWGNPAAYKMGDIEDQQLFGQHDAHWIPKNLPGEGNIILYNNGVGRPELTRSSVDEWKPPVLSDGSYELSLGRYGPEKVDWTYGLEEEHKEFFAQRISGVQRQANGNTLVCVGSDGLFFEINQEQKLVWEYINPLRNGLALMQGDAPRQNEVFRSYRYPSDYPAFENKTLIPGDVLELNPLPSDCKIYEEGVGTNQINNLSGVDILINPVVNDLIITNNRAEKITFSIFDLSGQFISKGTLNSGISSVNAYNLKSGMYIVRFATENIKHFTSKKFIKI